VYNQGRLSQDYQGWVKKNFFTPLAKYMHSGNKETAIFTNSLNVHYLFDRK